MKSVVHTILIFIGLYIITSSGILEFFAQKSFLIFAVASVFVMLAIAFILLNLKKNSKGENNDKK